MSALSYRPELDGLRSIAVYLVLLFHAGMVTFEGGFIGVDVFFVLSGFLVTAVILDEVDRRGTFDLGNFYARRVRRLLPAAVVLIVVTSLFQLLVASLPARLEMIDDARASLLYYANWHFILESRDYFAAAAESGPFLHFWSLSIEEQFYIGFPLLVLATLKWSARPMRMLVILLAGIAVLSIGLQLWHAASDATYAYYATEARIYQLGVGALLTVAFRALVRYDRTSGVRRAAGALGLVGLVSVVLVASRLVDVSASARGLAATAGTALLITGLWWAQTGRLARLLGTLVPRYLGQISYGTYLWHWPVLLVLGEVFDARPGVLALLGAAVATGLAALSFTLMESPVRRTPAFARRRWSVVAIGVAAGIVAAFVVVPPVLERDRRPVLSAGAQEDPGSLASGLDRPVPPDLDLVAAKDDTGPGSQQCTVDDPGACTRVQGSEGHVLLLGDSQARTYIPALERIAERRSLTFSTNVVNTCPWQLGQVNLRAHEARQQTCQEAREVFFADVLPQMDVDVVLAVGLSRSDEFWSDLLTGRGADAAESLEQLQTRTTRETADAVTRAGPELVIARSMIGTEGFGVEGFDPLECLSRARLLADCAVTPPLDRPAVDGVYSVLAAEEPGVHTVDINPVICPDHPVCSPVQGGTVVWRDPDHVTASVLVENRGKIWERLRATGAFG